jgi:hypothetical protein
MWTGKICEKIGLEGGGAEGRGAGGGGGWWAAEVVIFCGPVGDQEITRTMWMNRLGKIEKLCSELDLLNNSQVQLALLRSCAGFPKINFALRTCNPLFLDGHLENFFFFFFFS